MVFLAGFSKILLQLWLRQLRYFIEGPLLLDVVHVEMIAIRADVVRSRSSLLVAMDVIMACLRPLTWLRLVRIVSMIIHKLIDVSLIVILSTL